METKTATSLNVPFVDQEAAAEDVSYVKCPDEEEKPFQIGGPLSCGIWCFLLHVVMGIFMSSFSYIPCVGESPTWFRATFFAVATFLAFMDHIYVTSDPKEFDRIFKMLLPVALLGLVFFFAKLYTVFPVGESTALLFLALVIMVVPGVVYTKATGKDAPAVHSEVKEALASWAGIAHHAGADTALTLYFVLCWTLMGQPPLMQWLQ